LTTIATLVAALVTPAAARLTSLRDFIAAVEVGASTASPC
jgi:hypothetical protein